MTVSVLFSSRPKYVPCSFHPKLIWLELLIKESYASDGTEREYEGSAVTVPDSGLELAWSRIPGGSYEYCFGLADLSGAVHYTDSVSITF